MGYSLHLYGQSAHADAIAGGPIVWVSEVDAKKIGIKDNDWLEVFNTNGAIMWPGRLFPSA
jgi:nitrate reductase alpha subunit